MRIPGSIDKCVNHDREDIHELANTCIGETEHTCNRGTEHNQHGGELDYLHIRLLNKPWNNIMIVSMMFFQGIAFLLLSTVVYFRNIRK